VTKKIIDQLQPIFAPQSVAVIGASSAPFKWGTQTLHRLRATGYEGALYPINPKEKEIMGMRVYPSVLDVPEKIDLAVITLRAEMVPQAMRECVQKDIKGAIIISADFAETGSRGQALQDEVTKISRQGGLRFVGPNCFGVWNAVTNLNTLPVVPAKGEIGFISQSGSLTHMVARVAHAKGYGLSKLISVGNQADLDVADYLEYLTEDPHTKVIVIYLEGFRDGRKLFRVAKEINGKKPVVVYKTGNHPGSERVSMSHTAAMIGEDRVFNAMCQQVGFIRADTLFGTMDMAGILTKQPLPKGNRIGIQGTGGQCMILTDTCLSLGMEVPELKDEDASFVISGLDFPPHAPPPKNPVDFAGSHTAFMDATVINNLAQLDYIDGIISYRPVTFHFATSGTSDKQREMDTKVGELLAEVPNKYGKPVVLLGPSSLITNDEFRTSEIITEALESSGIPCYQTMEDAAMAMYTLVRYAEIKRRSTGE